MKALVIEDSEPLRRSLATGLTRSGFSVDVVGDGEEGLHFARHGRYDVVVLDLMLPKRDGMSVLRSVRAEHNGVHVLVLSARDRLEDRLAGLAAGADDYLVKPFEFDELVARMRALVRRRYGQKNPVHRAGRVTVDTARRAATCDDRVIDLSAREYGVLEHLLLRRGAVVSKAELLERLYTDTDRGTDNTVEVFVHQLRRKLLAATGDQIVRTRRGLGYIVE